MSNSLVQKLKLSVVNFLRVRHDSQTTPSLSVEELEDRMMLSSVVEADYRDDFQTGSPSSDWQYLWNAPSDWTGTSSADAADQRFGDPEHYVPLQTSDRGYQPAGNEEIDLSEPHRNLRLSKTGGRVGAGFQQTDSNNRVTRFAIAAWTVQEDGVHAIRDSWFKTNATSKGVDIVIHVNDEDPIYRRRLAGPDEAFNTDLGYLKAGDVVYVGFGGGANDQGGTFQHDFSIVKLDSPGLTVLHSDGVSTVSEPGTTDTFTVSLNARPESTKRIIVDIEVEDPTELSTNRRRLFFNRSNWNVAQTVTVTGVDDDLDDGISRTRVTARINPATANLEYLDVQEKSIIVSNMDNEILTPLASQIGSGIVRGLNRIVLVPGEYDLSPVNPQAAHLYISWAEDVTIVADDVKINATEFNTGVVLRDSSDVTLQGLTFDHSRLPFTQANITGFAADKSWFDIQIHAGYELPQDGDSTRMIFHDRNSRLVKENTLARFDATVTELGGRHFRVNTFAADDEVNVGDFVSLTLPINTPHAIWVDESQRIKLKNVTVNSSTSFAFFETLGEANEYFALTVTPGDRPEGANIDRLISSNYDGFHSKNASVGPKVESSRFSDTGDDGIAINGSYGLLVRNEGDSIVVASKWRLTRFEAGDRIRVYSEATGTTSVATVTEVTPYEDGDIDFENLRDQLLPNLRNPESQFRDGYRLTLSQPIEGVAGDLISNLDRIGAGFEIRDNVVENTRARGFALKSPSGVVEGNDLEHIAVTGILISPESTFWMEGDFARQVEIRDNHIKNAGFFIANANRRVGGGILVVADPNLSFRGHRNIEIENNLLERIEGPSIAVSNAIGVRVLDNWIRESNRTENGFGQGSAIWIENANNIRVDGNTLDRPGDYLTNPLIASNVNALDDQYAFQSVADSLSQQQWTYIEDVWNQWHSEMDPDLTTAQRNRRVIRWQSELAEYHLSRAANLESRGLFNSARYWAKIAIAERAFVSELQLQSGLDFLDVAEEWTS
jgi:hypothetical protein